MWRYFMSYRFEDEDGGGFGNCIAESYYQIVDQYDLKHWTEMIEHDNNHKGVVILNICELERDQETLVEMSCRLATAEADAARWQLIANDMEILATRLAATLGVIKALSNIEFSGNDNLLYLLSVIRATSENVIEAWEMSLDDVLTQTRQVEAAHDAAAGDGTKEKMR